MPLKSLNNPGISERGHKNTQEIWAVSAGIYRFGSASNYLFRTRTFGQTTNRRDALTLNFWRCSGTYSVKFTHLIFSSNTSYYSQHANKQTPLLQEGKASEICSNM